MYNTTIISCTEIARMITDCPQALSSSAPYCLARTIEPAAARSPGHATTLSALPLPLLPMDTEIDLERLTLREREIMTWIARGKTDWQTGHILEISAKTVNFHVERAKRKLGATTRAHAIVIAGNLGQLDTPVALIEVGRI
jgi:DNA-binding CsgD family transcriptional regulator